MNIDPTKSFSEQIDMGTIERLRKMSFYGDLAAQYLKEKLRTVDELCTCEFQDTSEQLVIIRDHWCIGTVKYAGMIRNYPTIMMQVDRPNDPSLTDEAFDKLIAFLKKFAQQHNIFYHPLYLF